jgi:hypothetical protein
MLTILRAESLPVAKFRPIGTHCRQHERESTLLSGSNAGKN